MDLEVRVRLESLLDGVQAVDQIDLEAVSMSDMAYQVKKQVFRVELMLEKVNEELGEILCLKS